MAGYNRKTTKTAPVPVKAVKPAAGVIGTKKSGARATTFEGHEGYQRKDKSALFLLGAGSLGGEGSFYESADARTKRFVDLVRKVAVKDPKWTGEFLNWLRNEGNIRTAAVVGAVEAADALAKAGIPGGRQIVASVLQRADEPGEVMAYWAASRGWPTVRGSKAPKVIMPISIKRGIADAVLRLYTEFSFLKHDSERSPVRFGDVIEMVHPRADLAAALRKFPEIDEAKAEVEAEDMSAWLFDQTLRRDQKINDWLIRTNELFRYAIEKRHNRGLEPGESLEMVRAARDLRARFEEDPQVLLDTEALKAAGFTWEDALSLAGTKLDKALIWKSVLPTIGYMALLRNLRNIDEAKVSDADVAAAIARIQDPDQVARSRQLPFRFYSAYKNAPSLRWGHALDVALNESLKNVPALGGRTLILNDTSGSMGQTLSGKSEMTYQEVAGLFGLALGLKGEADVWAWASDAYQFEFVKGHGASSVLRNLEKYQSERGRVGVGTDLTTAIRKSYVRGKYDRMVVISDMQVLPYGKGLIPTDIPCYFFNLAGYAAAAVETTGQVYELGGLTDHTFKMITMLEAGESSKWPWEA